MYDQSTEIFKVGTTWYYLETCATCCIALDIKTHLCESVNGPSNVRTWCRPSYTLMQENTININIITFPIKAHFHCINISILAKSHPSIRAYIQYCAKDLFSHLDISNCVPVAQLVKGHGFNLREHIY